MRLAFESTVIGMSVAEDYAPAHRSRFAPFTEGLLVFSTFLLQILSKSDIQLSMEDKAVVTVSEAFLKGMEHLKTLMEMSAILSSTLDLDDLIFLVMEKAKGDLDAETCSILFYNKETKMLEFKGAICEDEKASGVLQKKGTLEMGKGIAGAVAETLQPVFLQDVSTDSRFSQEADRFKGFPVKSLIAIPLVGRSGLIGVAEVMNPRKKDYDPEIVRLLARQFAIAIENSIFYKESIERERLKQELDIASSLQRSFLPESSTFRKGDLSVSAGIYRLKRSAATCMIFSNKTRTALGYL
jgi:phosphoserine phosphatase RsbU/P